MTWHIATFNVRHFVVPEIQYPNPPPERIATVSVYSGYVVDVQPNERQTEVKKRVVTVEVPPAQ